MARIVSGFQTQGGEWDGGAVLRGFKQGQDARLNEEQNSRANAGMMLQIQRALMEQAQQDEAQRVSSQRQAAAQQQNAEMGKAGRLQQMAQRAQAGQVNPGQKFMERVIGARSRLQDPKALALFDESVGQLVKSQEMAKKRKAAEEAIGMAEKDAEIFPPEMVQGLRQQMDAGGDLDSIVRGIGEHRMKTATTQHDVSENEDALARAAEMVRLAQPGYGKKRAQIILNAVMSSNALKEREGSGAQALQAIQKELLGTRAEFAAQDPNAAPAPGLQGMTVDQRNKEMSKEPFMGFGGPDVPQFIPRGPQAHATVKRGNVSPRGLNKVVSEAVRGGARGADLVKLLRDQGADPNDPATLAQIEAALSGGQ